LLTVLVGCSGSGRIELAALNFRAIDPPAAPSPRVVRVNLDRCYWWTDQADRLWLAMEHRRLPLLNPRLRVAFQLSLALEKLPAGPARDYHVGPQTLRGLVRAGPWESRLTARRGIIALYRESGNRLRGSLRIEAVRVSAGWLGHWSRPKDYLLLGTFVAVPDRGRGRAILAATESAGWERGPTTRPAAQSRPAGEAADRPTVATSARPG